MSLASILGARIVEANSKVDKKGVKKVLDVSNMDSLGGGTRIVARPVRIGAEATGAKKMFAGLDIVSDNAGAYKMAAEALGRRDLAREYQRVWGATGVQTKVKGSPKVVAKTDVERLVNAVNRAIADGKLVDVSNLNATDLGGFRTISPFDKDGNPKFGPSYKGAKRQVGDLPIISSNYDNYARAVFAIDRADLAREFAHMHGEIAAVVRGSPKAGAKSPGIKRDASAAERVKAMYEKAQAEGGQLDVSGITGTGQGTRIMFRKAEHTMPDERITKYSVVGSPFIVSNNYVAYELAAALLDEAYGVNNFGDSAREFERIHGRQAYKKPEAGLLKAKKSPKIKGAPIRRSASPVRSRSRSPSPRAKTPSPRARTPSPRVSPRVSPRAVAPRVVAPRGRTVQRASLLPMGQTRI